MLDEGTVRLIPNAIEVTPISNIHTRPHAACLLAGASSPRDTDARCKAA